ncbi:MAG: hypothetical protein QM635_06120 [Microbacteriaceae bacterium]
MAVSEERDRLAAELQSALARLAEAETESARLRSRLRRAQLDAERAAAQLRRMRRSASWRLTFPMRMLGRRLFGHRRAGQRPGRQR